MRNEGTLSKRKERELVQSINVVNKVIEFREVHEFHEGNSWRWRNSGRLELSGDINANNARSEGNECKCEPV